MRGDLQELIPSADGLLRIAEEAGIVDGETDPTCQLLCHHEIVARVSPRGSRAQELEHTEDPTAKLNRGAEVRDDAELALELRICGTQSLARPCEILESRVQLRTARRKNVVRSVLQLRDDIATEPARELLLVGIGVRNRRLMKLTRLVRQVDETPVREVRDRKARRL